MIVTYTSMFSEFTGFHSKATCSPSGENVGAHSHPGREVSGTSCGDEIGEPLLRRRAQARAITTRPVASARSRRRPLLRNGAGSVFARSAESESSLICSRSSLTSAMLW
jgi:hypothetical protein